MARLRRSLGAGRGIEPRCPRAVSIGRRTGTARWDGSLQLRIGWREVSRSSDRDRGAQEAGALAHQPTHAESWEHARVNPAASSPHELATRTTFEFVSRYWDVGRGVLPSAEPPRILEVGCGDGRLAELLTAHGCQVLAVDSEPSAVDRARARGIAAACTEWPKFELPAATRFDLILFTRSPHHISDLEGGVRRARELLRPGGECGWSVHRVRGAATRDRRARRALETVDWCPFRRDDSVMTSEGRGC